jgi:hypothetical protein
MKKACHSTFIIVIIPAFSPLELQSETFSPPNAQQAAKGAQSIPSYHGTTGPVQVTYPDLMYGGPQQPAFINTIVGLTGIKHYKDLNGGTPNCVSITPLVRPPPSFLFPLEMVSVDFSFFFPLVADDKLA